MTSYLPASIMALFEPRPPLKPLPLEKKQLPSYTGVADFAQYFEDPETAPAPEPWNPPESRWQRKYKKLKYFEQKHQQELKEQLKKWDPQGDSQISGDPYHTIFVAKLHPQTTEEALKKEFEQYGPIKRIRLVKDVTTLKSKRYAFIEYERNADMNNALKYGDNRKIDGRRVIVDIERGRTSSGWRPRRLGGGKKRQPYVPTREYPPRRYDSYHSSSSSSSRPRRHPYK